MASINSMTVNYDDKANPYITIEYPYDAVTLNKISTNFINDTAYSDGLDFTRQLSEALTKVGISATEAAGAIKKMSELMKESAVRLRPEASKKTEKPNQKIVFDFLKQNAYDDIELEKIIPLDSI